MKVGAAYHEMGEFERSYLVFRATVESSFVRDSGVAGFLESQGQFVRSVDVLSRLLREYPPEGYVAEAAYSLAQHVYAKAAEVAAARPQWPARGRSAIAQASAGGMSTSLRRRMCGRAEKLNRVDLVRRAWAMLESFLTDYPDDPAADQAAFAAATRAAGSEGVQGRRRGVRPLRQALSEERSAGRLLVRDRLLPLRRRPARGGHGNVPQSGRGEADRPGDRPRGGQPQQVAGDLHPRPGLSQPGQGRRGDPRVSPRGRPVSPTPSSRSTTSSARRSNCPRSSTFKPGEPAEVELKFRNVAACDLKVYRIDLMKFGLLKRNLGGIAQINLAGIRPHHEATVALGDGKDYRDRTRKLPLPLKEEGAYLVVCRGDDLHASGLVLVTPLAVEVQADAGFRPRPHDGQGPRGRQVPAATST